LELQWCPRDVCNELATHCTATVAKSITGGVCEGALPHHIGRCTQDADCVEGQVCVPSENNIAVTMCLPKCGDACRNQCVTGGEVTPTAPPAPAPAPVTSVDPAEEARKKAEELRKAEEAARKKAAEDAARNQNATTISDYDYTDHQPRKGGSVLPVLFITFFSLYCVIGVVYNRVVRKATGFEQIPNAALWGGLLHGLASIPGRLCRRGGGGGSGGWEMASPPPYSWD